MTALIQGRTEEIP